MKPSSANENRSRTIQLFVAFSLLVLVVWIARFQRSSEFGLYEDDWTVIPIAADMNLEELTEFVSDHVTHFRGKGRPLHHTFIYTLSFLGWNIGELDGIYFLGFVIVSLNAILFYLLVRRIHSHRLALVGALAFALYSADTTQAFLTHSLGLQTALTLFLLASHSYISHKYVLSYILILASLLTYETIYFVFLAVPLLCLPLDRAWPKAMAKHIVITLAIFFGVFLIRIDLGDLNAANLSTNAPLSSSLRHMVLGPIWSLRSYVYRSAEVYRSLDTGLVIGIGLSFGVFLIGL